MVLLHVKFSEFNETVFRRWRLQLSSAFQWRSVRLDPLQSVEHPERRRSSLHRWVIAVVVQRHLSAQYSSSSIGYSDPRPPLADVARNEDDDQDDQQTANCTEYNRQSTTIGHFIRRYHVTNSNDHW